MSFHRDEAPSRATRGYVILAGFFLGALVLTNLIAGKFFVLDLFGRAWPLSCGIIAYPVTFLVTDLVSEVYGEHRARHLVFTGFGVSVFATLIIVIATAVPTFEQSPVSQDAFVTVFGLLPGIVFGSMIAYLTAQFVDVKVFEFWRRLTDGRYLWLRNNASTVFSQLVDTVLVVTIALVIWPQMDAAEQTQPITLAAWGSIIVGQYFFKAAIALFDTPLFYLGTRWLNAWIEGDPARRVEVGA